MQRRTLIRLSAAIGLILVASVNASDWPRFRGPNGSGISPDEQPAPVKWSETENLKWKLDLPGPGSSSPIVVGERVFVTCWTGYATQRGNPGEQQDLRRHLICVDRQTGKVLWDQAVEPVLPEDPYSGMFTQHGYASHTPVADGQRVYAYFGKTGVVAFDLDGKRLWQKSLGTESGAQGWGSASSPIVYNNLVIATASAESEALVALNKDTGEEVWRKEAAGFSGTWGTPVLVDCGGGRTDLVLAVPFELWGFDPATRETALVLRKHPLRFHVLQRPHPRRDDLRNGKRPTRRRNHRRSRRRRGRSDGKPRGLEGKRPFANWHAALPRRAVVLD